MRNFSLMVLALLFAGHIAIAQNYYYAVNEPQESPIPPGAKVISTVEELIAGLKSDSNLYLEAGEYKLPYTINLNNIHDLNVLGADGAVIKGNLQTLLQFFKKADNISFKNITFNSTATIKEEYGGGIVIFHNTSAENILFEGCSFTCPELNQNGLKFISEGSARSKNINILNCQFKNIGRMAIETQNHTEDYVVRIKNVSVINCYFENLGTQSPYGMAISLSGSGKNGVLKNNTIKDAKYHGIECVGWSDLVISNNKFSSKNNAYNPFNVNQRAGYTNYLTNIIITENSGTVSGVTSHLVAFGSIDGLLYSNNSFYADALYAGNVKNSLFTNNFHSSDGGISLYVERKSNNNNFKNNTIISTRDNANTVVFFLGSTANTMQGNTVIKKGKGGSRYDDEDGGNFILD